MRQQAQDLAATLPPLLVAAHRVASTVSPGAHGRRRSGPGDAFWQFRAYQPFDAARMIDWRRSARGSTTYIREREFETAQTVYLWRDVSPSMRWRSDRRLVEKRERADLLTLALVILLIEAGERVALLGEPLRPRTGQPAIEPIAQLLAMTKDGGASLPAYEPLPRNATVVLIGDLLDPLTDLSAVVKRWAGEAVTGHLLQVTDPSEEGFPYRGRIRFEGLEAEAPHLLGRAEAISTDYRERLVRHRDGLTDLARTTGWTFAQHTTDRSAESALLALFGMIGGRFA
jgi:uncharacterized protein (DUF58 family)